MKYLDSAGNDPSETLGSWLQATCTKNVKALRWQTGYFDVDGIGPMLDSIEHLVGTGQPIRAVIGSNDATAASDVLRLVQVLALPQASVSLGIVTYSGALFHPKVVHVTRDDGSAAAYVGSANMTFAGVTAVNVEAGVVLDTKHGDPGHELDRIAAAIDAWFVQGRPEVSIVTSAADVQVLVEMGVLAKGPTQRTPREKPSGVAETTVSWPNRKPLVSIPTVPPLAYPIAAPTKGATAGGTAAAVNSPPPVPASASTPTPRAAVQHAPAAAAPAPTAPAATWATVWRSNALTERDLNIPKATNTHVTGSMTLKKGAWGVADQKHDFRSSIFVGLPWGRHPNPSMPKHEVAVGEFEFWKNGARLGTKSLTLTHNNDTTTASYKQNNAMSHLRWGDALPWVQDRTLLGGTITLSRENVPAGKVPRFKVELNGP